MITQKKKKKNYKNKIIIIIFKQENLNLKPDKHFFPNTKRDIAKKST